MADIDLYEASKIYVRLASNDRPDEASEVFWFCFNTMRRRWQGEDRTSLYDDVIDELGGIGSRARPESSKDAFYTHFFLMRMLSSMPGILPRLHQDMSYDDMLCSLVEYEEDLIVAHMDVRLEGRRFNPTEFSDNRFQRVVRPLCLLIPEISKGVYANFGAFLGGCVSWRTSLPFQITSSNIVALWQEALRRGDNERST